MERVYPIIYPDMQLGHRSEAYQRYPGLLDIEQEAISILQGVPLDKAVSTALAASQEMPDPLPPRGGTGNTHIPAVVIFSREGENPENIWRKLLTVLQTSDFNTPSYTPEARPLINALKTALLRSGYTNGVVGAIGSAHMIRVAGGNPAAIEWTYRDMGRRYPQNAAEWYETLEHQFKGAIRPAKSESPIEQSLAHMLETNLEIAARHDALHNRRFPGEDPPSFVARQLDQAGEIFGINSVEDLARAAAIMDRVFRGYRKEACVLRGIPYEK